MTKSNLQVEVKITEDIQFGNLSVKLSSTKYPICYSRSYLPIYQEPNLLIQAFILTC